MADNNRKPQPLVSNQPVVNSDGTPTQYFIRWAQARQLAIGDSLTLDDLTAFLADHELQAGVGITITPDGNIASDPTIALHADLGDLLDVDFSTPPTNGQILIYDATTSTWKPGDQTGGGGDIMKIAQVITAASQTTISFPAIPATFDSLRLVVNSRCTVGANNGELHMQVNGDTGGNYDWGTENRFGNNAGNAVTSMYCGDPSGTGTTANYTSTTIIDIPDYTNTTWYKSLLAYDQILVNPSSGGMFGQRFGGWWRSTAAINAILLTLNSGNFIDGSIATLYGIR